MRRAVQERTTDTENPSLWRSEKSALHPLALGGLIAILLIALPATAPAQEQCPNSDVRVGASAELPDCRAYELVSPPNKNGYDAYVRGATSFSSADGNRFVFGTSTSVPGSPNSILSQFGATRRGKDWIHRPVSLPITEYHTYNTLDTFKEFACDNCDSVVGQVVESADPGDTDSGLFGPNPDVYISNGPGDYHWVSRGTIGGDAPVQARYAGRSDDGTVIAFDIPEALLPAAGSISAGSPIAYARINDETILVGRDEEAHPIAGGSIIGGGSNGRMINAVSSDGSRIFFQGVSNQRLYVREGNETTHVSAPQCNEAGCGTGTGTFQGATTSGGRVFFSSSEQLTDEDQNTDSDLYEYDLESDQLRLLTVPETDGGPTWIFPVRASSDGSRIYFSSLNKLTSTPTPDGRLPAQGMPNLYRLNTKTREIAFIASNVGIQLATQNDASAEVSLSGDGKRALFATAGDPLSKAPGTRQVYLYDDATHDLLCVSCPGSGTPSGDSELAHGGRFGARSNLSKSGNVAVFESRTSLLGRDRNASVDVYRWKDGQLALISTGRSQQNSRLIDVSEDGRSIFFATTSSLVEADPDTAVDVYVARVGGGFDEGKGGTGSLCEADGCQPAPAQPGLPALGTGTYSGTGNVSRDNHHQRCRRIKQRAARKKRKARLLIRRARKASGQRGTRMKKRASKARTKATRAKKRVRKCAMQQGEG